MNRISLALSKGARGEIISLNPNLTSARKTKPNINMTTPGALRDLCNWSLDYEQQKSMESEAIAQMNGRVKIHIDGTIMNGLQDKNLRRILLLGYQSFEQRNVNSFEELENNPALETFIASMSPVILKPLAKSLGRKKTRIALMNSKSLRVRASSSVSTQAY